MIEVFLLLQVFPLYVGQIALARCMGIASQLPIRVHRRERCQYRGVSELASDMLTKL